MDWDLNPGTYKDEILSLADLTNFPIHALSTTAIC